MKGNMLGTALLVILGISAVMWGLVGLFDYNLITKFFPEYAKWIYTGFGIVGGWVLYTSFRK